MSGPAPGIRGVSFPAAAFEEDCVAHTFLGRHLMILSRPESVCRVLVENAANYVRPHAAYRILDAPIGGGLFLAEGEEWRRQRRMLAPSFAMRAVAGFAAHVVREGQRFLDELAAGADREAELFRPLQELTLVIAGAALFSIDMRQYGHEVHDLSRYYSDRLGRADMLDFLLPRWIPSPRDIARRHFHRRWMALIGRIVAERRARPGAAPDLFDLLVASEEKRGLLERQVATMLITGSETTGVALFWSIHLLAQFAEVQDRVAAEAAQLDLGPETAAASLLALTYTRAVVHEAMRLYPPAFSIARRAINADRAGDITIPAGAYIQTAPWVIHRHRALWPEPERFAPERFLADAPAPQRGAYIPFGLGSRACIGMQFALAETVLVVAMLARAFVIEPASPAPVTPIARITLQPENPPLYRLRRR